MSADHGPFDTESRQMFQRRREVGQANAREARKVHLVGSCFAARSGHTITSIVDSRQVWWEARHSQCAQPKVNNLSLDVVVSIEGYPKLEKYYCYCNRISHL